jgi:hypothetical protein
MTINGGCPKIIVDKLECNGSLASGGRKREPNMLA